MKYLALFIILTNLVFASYHKFEKINCITTNTWAPFNIKTDKKKLEGISADLWNLIAKRANINTGNCKIADNFTEVLNAIKTKKADLTISASITQDRLKYANFSHTYESFPIVIATNDKVGFISDTIELVGKKVAVGKNFTSTIYMKEKYKNIDYIEVKNMQEALSLVASGEAYAAIDVLPVIAYIIKKDGYTNLKISGKTEFMFDLKIMIRKDYVDLLEVVNEQIDKLTKEEKDAIIDKWISVNISSFINTTWLIESGGILLLLIILWIAREYSQNKYHKELNTLLVKLEEKNKLLKELSITDKLTNLFNRVELDSSLKSNTDMFKRYNKTFSLIILDIDDFKNVNDTCGHMVGDEVLKAFASIIKEYTRTTDTVGRWGGEEFLIIAPETDSVGAYRLATLLKDKIAEFDFPEAGHLTASFGVAQIDIEDSIKDLVNKADHALYRAKDEGKNRVVCSL